MTKSCVAVFAVIVMAVAMVCAAQQPSPVTDPETERILDNAVNAEGRADALNALQTLRVKGGVYSGPSFRTSDFESIVAFPYKFRDTFATFSYGYDGTSAWAESGPDDGMTGLPRIQLMLPAVQWRKRYTSAKVLGQRRIGKHDAYVVRAGIRGQITQADYYYDSASFLLLRVDAVLQPNSIVITYLISDYKDTDGLKIPREWDFGGSRALVESVKVNVPLADKQFARPR